MKRTIKMDIIKNIMLIITGFSSGAVVSAGVFAFIAVIGIVPRMAHRTGTRDHIKTYEKAIIAGGIWGSTDMFIKYTIPIGDIGAVITGLSMGIFVGTLAMSLSEVMNVFPIFMKRGQFTKCLSAFVLVVALGKLTSSLIYVMLPSFY